MPSSWRASGSSARGRVSELNRLLVYHVRDGELVECWIYDADQRLVDEFLA
jgi:uncharacterized protein